VVEHADHRARRVALDFVVDPDHQALELVVDLVPEADLRAVQPSALGLQRAHAEAVQLRGVEAAMMSSITFGSIAALVSGLLALAAFVWLLRTQRFYIFAWYAWVVGAATVVWALR